MTPNQMIEVMDRFNFRCALTDSTDYHIDHFIPQSKGGITDVRNCYPLNAEINLKKGNRNPFLFFESSEIATKFERERFEELVFWLALLNDMTVQEFREYTFEVYEKGVL